jgi:two-component system NtrC family response regulator
MPATILVVDDDVSVTTSLALLLKQAGFAQLSAATPAEALARLDARAVDLVIQDMNFARATTGDEGLRLLREIRARYPGIPVVLITAWGSIALAVEGMRSGAADFVTKPWDNARLVGVIQTALSLASIRDAALDHGAATKPPGFAEIIGTDAGLLRLLSQVARIAKTDASVLLAGESGTGKELLARAIHKNSSRAAGPLVTVNMGSIVPSLFESEMFGHVRGAFTDARDNHSGYFEQAHGGTIFLDEVADLDPASQVKLLRVLQDHEIRRVGSRETRKGDFRVIAASNQHLGKLVAANRFREDLYYRLNLITVELPPLRERKRDIQQIAAVHLRDLKARYGLTEVSCTGDAFEWLERQQWPGNIRQLKHCIERAALLSGHGTLTRADFESFSSGEESFRPSAVSEREALKLDEVERSTIEKAMAESDNNISRAAVKLGVSRPALYRRLAKYGFGRQ